MNLLFLGAFFEEDEETDLLANSKGVGLQTSGTVFQRNIIKGLYENTNATIDIINCLPIGAYPKTYSKVLTHRRVVKNSIYNKITTGSINFQLIKQISSIIMIYSEIVKWLKKHKSEKKHIVIYNLHFCHLVALSLLTKKQKKQLIICPFMADLIGELEPVVKETRTRRLFNKYRMKLIQQASCYVLLTKQMNNIINLLNKPYTIIEGFALSNTTHNKINQTDKTIILYSGGLYKIYGIDILLDAFTAIKDNKYELWLCGSGDYEKEIIEKSKKDSRVIFYGYLTHKEIINLQNKATILINPRQNKGEYTKYSFPSKIFEYLSSGRPTIAYRLDGVADIYYNYIICPEDNSVEALTKKIVEVANITLDEKNRIGLSGREFVLENKNTKAQCKKIIDLLTSYSNE